MRRFALALCLLAGFVVSSGLGQDAKRDLRNDHLYGPFALIEGRFATESGAPAWGLRRAAAPCEKLPTPCQAGPELCAAEHPGPA